MRCPVRVDQCDRGRVDLQAGQHCRGRQAFEQHPRISGEAVRQVVRGSQPSVDVVAGLAGQPHGRDVGKVGDHERRSSVVARGHLRGSDGALVAGARRGLDSGPPVRHVRLRVCGGDAVRHPLSDRCWSTAIHVAGRITWYSSTPSAPALPGVRATTVTRWSQYSGSSSAEVVRFRVNLRGDGRGPGRPGWQRATAPRRAGGMCRHLVRRAEHDPHAGELVRW